jgi:hypothetical protein
MTYAVSIIAEKDLDSLRTKPRKNKSEPIALKKLVELSKEVLNALG